MDGKLWTEAREIAGRHARGDREDLAQDLAVAALESGGAVREPGAWLERVGRNAAIDRWRVMRRQQELAVEIDPPSSPLDPEAALLGRERRGLVRRALTALPRPQRRAALARFHGDLPYDEVAVRVGTAAITARTRVHRALASLRARLGALRAMFFFPGVQMSALGVALVVATSPALTPGQPRPTDEMTLGAPRVGRHFSRTTVIAESPGPGAAPKRPRPKIVTAPAPAPDEPPAVQRMVFGEEFLEGNVVGPEGERLTLVQPAAQPSLIEIRRDFLPETVKSLEDL